MVLDAPGWSETIRPNPRFRVTGTSERNAGFQRKYSIRYALFRQKRASPDNRFPDDGNSADAQNFP
jgi:hypothetical protein